MVFKRSLSPSLSGWNMLKYMYTRWPHSIFMCTWWGVNEFIHSLCVNSHFLRSKELTGNWSSCLGSYRCFPSHLEASLSSDSTHLLLKSFIFVFHLTKLNVGIKLSYWFVLTLCVSWFETYCCRCFFLATGIFNSKQQPSWRQLSWK